METIKFFMKKYHRLIFGVIGMVLIIYILKSSNLQNLTIRKNPQYDYAAYLIENNDLMMENILEFEKGIKYTGIYTEREKEKLSSLIVNENEIVRDVQVNPPNESNSDYASMHEAFLKGHAFYIQGQIMKLENVYSEDNTESLIMGTTLTDIVGNIVFRISHNVNKVRNTEIPYEHGVAKDFELGMDKLMDNLSQPKKIITKKEP